MYLCWIGPLHIAQGQNKYKHTRTTDWKQLAKPNPNLNPNVLLPTLSGQLCVWVCVCLCVCMQINIQFLWMNTYVERAMCQHSSDCNGPQISQKEKRFGNISLNEEKCFYAKNRNRIKLIQKQFKEQWKDSFELSFRKLNNVVSRWFSLSLFPSHGYLCLF